MKKLRHPTKKGVYMYIYLFIIIYVILLVIGFKSTWSFAVTGTIMGVVNLGKSVITKLKN